MEFIATRNIQNTLLYIKNKLLRNKSKNVLEIVQACIKDERIDNLYVKAEIHGREITLIFTNPDKQQNEIDALKAGSYLLSSSSFKIIGLSLKVLCDDRVLLSLDQLISHEIIRYVDRNAVAHKSMKVSYWRFCIELVPTIVYILLNHKNGSLQEQMYEDCRNKISLLVAKHLSSSYLIEELQAASSLIQDKIRKKKSIVSALFILTALCVSSTCTFLLGIEITISLIGVLWATLVTLEGWGKRLIDITLSTDEKKSMVIKNAIELAKSKP
jgi:hypothetical protein